MSSAGSSNTASVLYEIQPGATVNLASYKGYYLINYTGVSRTEPNDIGIIAIERNTGRVLNVPLYAIMHISGKEWSSITYNNGSGTVYICEDTVDIPSLYLNNLLPNALQTLVNGLFVSKLNVYSYMNIAVLSTTSAVIFQMPQNDPYPYTLWFSNFAAASGETDTLNITDIANNTIYSENITGLTNQKLVLPLSWSNGSYTPTVSVIASGVTSPSGHVTYVVYRGAL